MMISFRQKSGFEVVLQNACHGSQSIFSVYFLKMEPFPTPKTQSVSTLLIIFVMLLKNAQMQIELCEIPSTGLLKSVVGNGLKPFPTAVLLCAAINLPCAWRWESMAILRNAGQASVFQQLRNQ
jgi:hypothetical protein